MITLLSRCFIPAARRLQGWRRSWWPEIWFPAFQAFVAHQIRPHPGGSGRLEPSRVIGDLGDAMVLHNLLIHKYNRLCRSISISQHVVFITITKNKKNHSLKKKQEKKKKLNNLSCFFFLKQQITDYISMLYLLNPSSWRVDLLSVIYLLPYWPISGGGCTRLQVREWLLSTNSSLRAWEKNDSKSCVEQLINSVFMPTEEAALLLPEQGLPSIRPSGFFSKDNEPFCI